MPNNSLPPPNPLNSLHRLFSRKVLYSLNGETVNHSIASDKKTSPPQNWPHDIPDKPVNTHQAAMVIFRMGGQ